MARDGVQGLVSVVVASYNHAEFLARRMESLLDQTYVPMEILVIDDCSTDRSVEVLRRYGSQPRVKLVLRERNGGWVAVSNQGIEMATGEYILLANCDDACDPRMIERLVGSISQEPNIGVSFCRSTMIDDKDRILGDDFEVRERGFRTRCAADTKIGRDEMNRFLLHSCVIPNLSAALIRRRCFEVVGGLSDEYRACSDWEFFFRVASQFDFAYVAEPLNRFRQHPTTIRSAMKGRATLEEFLRLLLGRIGAIDLTALERLRYRVHAMYLWSIHLLSPRLQGLKDFPFHAKKVLSLDPASFFLLLPALMWRVVIVGGKFVASLLPQRTRMSENV